MILTVDDKPVYFPEVPLDGDALGAAILRAMVLVQGPQGANRQLSLKNYSEIVRVIDNIFWPSHAPIVEVTEVAGRQKRGIDNWNRLINTTEWVVLDTDSYEVEPELNRIILTTGDFYSEVRVKYISGYNFVETVDDPLTQEAIEIKAKLAAVLDYQQSAAGLGIKDLRSSDMKFQDSTPGVVPDELLMPFYRYRPRR